MEKYKITQCVTYEDAKSAAKELFKNNVTVYINKVTILNDYEHPYYIVSTDNNCVISDDRTVELVKKYTPSTINKIKIEDINKFYKKKSTSFYLIYTSFKDKIYYHIDGKPSLKDFIKNNYALIYSHDPAIRNASSYVIYEIESFEEFINRNNIKIFDKEFNNSLLKITEFTNLLLK
jgi:hypothetical protein